MKSAISPAARGGGVAVVTDGGTVSSMVTVVTDGGGVASRGVVFGDALFKKKRERLPAAEPKSSVRLVRSTVNVKVDVVLAGMVSRPLCGISHGTRSEEHTSELQSR